MDELDKYKNDHPAITVEQLFGISDLKDAPPLDRKLTNRLKKVVSQKHLFEYQNNEGSEVQHGRFIQAMSILFNDTLPDDSYAKKLEDKAAGNDFIKLKINNDYQLSHTFSTPFLDASNKPDFTLCDSTKKLSNATVVSMIEFFNGSKSDEDEHFKRIADYNKRVLDSQPLRTFIISAISDTAHIQFIKSSINKNDDKSDYIHLYTDPLAMPLHLHCLVLLLMYNSINGYVSI